MAILFQCQCGRKFKTGDEHAGRSATCPDCRTKLVVPAAATVPEAPQPILPPPIPDEDPSGPEHTDYGVQSQEVVPVGRRSAAAPYGRSGRDDREDRDDDYGRRRLAYRRDDIRNRIIRRPTPASNGWTDGGVLKGLGLMVLGAVITVGGLAVGWLVFPGPILFIAGIICLVKGIAQGKA
jgi:DNA-directed RNA polymerase subunit RPC12/RpoP